MIKLLSRTVREVSGNGDTADVASLCTTALNAMRFSPCNSKWKTVLPAETKLEGKLRIRSILVKKSPKMAFDIFPKFVRMFSFCGRVSSIGKGRRLLPRPPKSFFCNGGSHDIAKSFAIVPLV